MGIELTAVDDVGAGGVSIIDPQGVGAGIALEVAAVDDELGIFGLDGGAVVSVVAPAVELAAVDDTFAARLQLDGVAADKMADGVRRLVDIITVSASFVDVPVFIPDAVNLLGAAGLQLAAVDEELAAVFDYNEVPGDGTDM